MAWTLLAKVAVQCPSRLPENVHNVHVFNPFFRNYNSTSPHHLYPQSDVCWQAVGATRWKRLAIRRLVLAFNYFWQKYVRVEILKGWIKVGSSTWELQQVRGYLLKSWLEAQKLSAISCRGRHQWKKTFSFGHCPNEGGGPTHARIFWPPFFAK